MTIEDILRTMTIKAAENATRAFSKMAGQDVKVEVAHTHIQAFRKDIADVDLEARVAGVYLPVSGDVNGAVLLIFSEDTAYACLDQLFKRESLARHALSLIERSALIEVGNILCGSFLTVLSNTLKVKIVENIPSLEIDMYGAIVEHLVIQFSHKPEEVLLIEVKLVLSKTDLLGYVVIIFAFEEMKALIEKMRKPEPQD